MPNLATALKAEISRLARKEVRAEVEPMRKALAALKTELSATKKRLRDLESQGKQLARATRAAAPPRVDAAGAEEAGSFRFSAKGLATNRTRLGLSAEQYGRLVGATGQAVAAWEKGVSKPRAKYLLAIAGLRGVGKKEVARRLEAMAPVDH
jgi:DNA-binding transcriptional regulator YiaG